MSQRAGFCLLESIGFTHEVVAMVRGREPEQAQPGESGAVTDETGDG